MRVDIDEVDIPRFEQAKKATAFRRGDSQTPISLTLLRIEPLVIPKQTLTGETQERTDTRVLQAIFRVGANANHPKLYVGQQLDVFAATDREKGAGTKSRNGPLGASHLWCLPPIPAPHNFPPGDLYELF